MSPRGRGRGQGQGQSSLSMQQSTTALSDSSLLHQQSDQEEFIDSDVHPLDTYSGDDADCTGNTSIIHGTRGPSRSLKLAKLPPGSKLKIEMNKMKQAVGANRSSLSSYCGVIVRNSQNVPLHIESWDKLPESCLRKLLMLVKEKFDLPEDLEPWVYKTMRKLFNNYRYRLRKKWYSSDELAEQQRRVPPQILAQDWEILVQPLKNRLREKKTRRIEQSKRLTTPRAHQALLKLRRTRHKGGEPSLAVLICFA